MSTYCEDYCCFYCVNVKTMFIFFYAAQYVPNVQRQKFPLIQFHQTETFLKCELKAVASSKAYFKDNFGLLSAAKSFAI